MAHDRYCLWISRDVGGWPNEYILTVERGRLGQGALGLARYPGRRGIDDRYYPRHISRASQPSYFKMGEQ